MSVCRAEVILVFLWEEARQDAEQPTAKGQLHATQISANQNVNNGPEKPCSIQSEMYLISRARKLLRNLNTK